MLQKNLLKGYLFVIISAVVFGCNGLMVRFIYDRGINAMTLVFLRNTLCLPALAVAAWVQNRTLKIPLKALPYLSVTGVVGCCITSVLVFSSYLYIPSGTATVFHFIYPVVVVISEILFLRKAAGKGSLVSVLICAIGIALFYNPGQPLNWQGSALALLSGVTYAAYILLLANFRYREVSGFLLSFYVSLVSSVVLLLICLIAGMLTLPANGTVWLYCFGFSMVINFGAVVLFQQGTILVGGQRSSILSTLEPITAMVVGALFFQEGFTFRTILGCCFVILASILITLMDVKAAKKTQETQ